MRERERGLPSSVHSFTYGVYHQSVETYYWMMFQTLILLRTSYMYIHMRICDGARIPKCRVVRVDAWHTILDMPWELRVTVY